MGQLPQVRARALAAPFVVACAAWACGGDSCEDAFGGATCTYDGEITTGDTVLFKGEATIYEAVAQYGVGPGLPTEIIWGTSDETVLNVNVLTDLTASVVALDTGAAWVYALINEEFLDSALVTVVLRGGVRWRAALPGPAGAYPAIGEDSLVRVVTGGTSPLLGIYDPLDGTGSTFASCFSALGPSIGASSFAYATGPGCTRRHEATGGAAWTGSVGSADLGVAVAADGGAITVSGDSLYRLSATGTEVWARALGGTPVTAPLIGPGGDVFIGWNAGGADSVSRFGLDGTPRWAIEVPGLSPGTPATTATRLFFPRPGGIFALDTNGTVAWDRSFSGASATSRTSSPVHDDVVLFVQNEDALYSYTLGGTFVWFADSLGFGTTSGVVGAPVLLVDPTLVVPCRSSVAGEREVCAVRQSNGELSWRSPVGGGAAQGLAVGENGTIFVTRTLAGGGSELVALWSRVLPDIDGWPAEGGGQQHSRRR